MDDSSSVVCKCFQ